MGKFSDKLNCDHSFTFDDFLLLPGPTSILPSDARVDTKLTKNIRLSIPLISAAMDTVTETDMAIGMARHGGLGVIHRNLTIDKQTETVAKVKRSESLIIRNVVTVSPDDTISYVEALMAEKNITGFPVVNANKLVGILTAKDVRFENYKENRIRDVMTKDVITGEESIDINDAIRIMHKNRIEKLPLVNKNNELVGLITVKDILKRREFPRASRDKNRHLMVAAAVGLDEERVKRLLSVGVDMIVVDTAHGHNKKVLDFIRLIKKNYDCEIVGGNIATKEAAEDLITAGVDCVKVGVGPGSICLEGNTPILMTDNSVKIISDIKVGDSVITHLKRPRRVTKVYKRPYKGKIYSLTIAGCPEKLMITPNHPVLAISLNTDHGENKRKKYGPRYYFSKKKSNLGLKWTPIENLKTFDILAIPRPKETKSEAKLFDMADYLPNYRSDSNFIWSDKVGFNPNIQSFPDLARKFNTTPRVIGNIVAGKNSFNMEMNTEINAYLDSINYQRSIESIKINRYIEVDEKFMRLLGYYIAEGFVSGVVDNKQLCFAFSQDETEYHEDVKQLINSVFGYENSKVIDHDQRKASVVHVFNHAIASFFEFLIPDKSGNKKIPDFIFNQNRELLKQFLLGAIRGDGSIKEDGRITYATTSPSLAYQIAEIFMILGYMPSISKYERKNTDWKAKFTIRISGLQQNRFIDDFPELAMKKKKRKRKQQIWADENFIYVPIIEIKESYKDTEVFNLEVEQDQSYVANRIAVHNCITRIVTGVGVPQLTAVANVSDVAEFYDIPVIADGGVRNPSDIAKAIAVGADAVMLGNILAGTDESPGSIFFKQGRKFKQYRGMGSKGAMADRYFQKNVKFTPEGIEGLVPYKGSLNDIITSLTGGLRSSMSYVGASNINEMKKNAEITRTTTRGVEESHPHSMIVTDENWIK